MSHDILLLDNQYHLLTVTLAKIPTIGYKEPELATFCILERLKDNVKSPSARGGTHVWLSTYLGFCLAWAGARIVHMTSNSLWDYLACCFTKTLSWKSHTTSHHYNLYSFLCWKVPKHPGEEMKYKGSIQDWSIDVSSAICPMSHGPILVAIYCKKKLLWCDLRDALISLVFGFVFNNLWGNQSIGHGEL